MKIKIIIAWSMLISALLAFLSPIVAMFLADWHEKKEEKEKGVKHEIAKRSKR